MRKLWILISVLIIAGCGEDSTTPTVKPFALNIIVTEATGERMGAVEVRAHVQIPGLNPSANKSVTVVPFTTAVACDLEMNVFDMEDRLVRTMSSEGAMAGYHQWQILMEQDGVPLLGTALYRYELVATAAGQELFRQKMTMTVYDSFDFDRQPLLGVTDSEGRVGYNDQTRFPFLYAAGPQPHVDFDGQLAGEFDFSNIVAFTLTDTLTNDRIVVEAVVGPELNILTLVWDEALVATSGDFVSRVEVSLPNLEKAQPPAEFSLGQNYPNPFN
jgi:hypothetical protein